MWTSMLDLSVKRFLLTKLLGLFYPDVYYSSLSPLRVENLPRRPLPSSEWVRVRNRLAGVCGSDLHLLHLDVDPRVVPAAAPGHQVHYLGHEVVGEVIEIGDDVQHLRVGERVVFQSGPNCLSTGVEPPCRACAAGNYNLCERGDLPGPRQIGGGWSEEMLLHEQQLFPLPEGMSDEQGVLLEPSAVAVHAVLRRLPQVGERVLVIGAGTIGLLTLQVLRALVPGLEVDVMARHDFQVEQATRMGAAHIIYPQTAYHDIQRSTQARLQEGMFGNKVLLGGYDVIYDTVGSQKTLHHALRWTRAQGDVVLVGISLHLLHVDLSPVWYREVNLIGSTSHGMERWPLGTQEQRSTFTIAAELITQGHIHPEQLITHRFALNTYKDALITATSKKEKHAIKVVFDYSLLPASVVPNVRASAQQRYTQGRTTGVMTTQEKEGQAETPVPVSSGGTPLVRLLPRTEWYGKDEEEDEDDGNAETVTMPAIPKTGGRVPQTPAPVEEEETDDVARGAGQSQEEVGQLQTGVGQPQGEVGQPQTRAEQLQTRAGQPQGITPTIHDRPLERGDGVEMGEEVEEGEVEDLQPTVKFRPVSWVGQEMGSVPVSDLPGRQVEEEEGQVVFAGGGIERSWDRSSAERKQADEQVEERGEVGTVPTVVPETPRGGVSSFSSDDEEGMRSVDEERDKQVGELVEAQQVPEGNVATGVRGPVPEEIVGVETGGAGLEETIGAEAGGPEAVPEEVREGVGEAKAGGPQSEEMMEGESGQRGSEQVAEGEERKPVLDQVVGREVRELVPEQGEERGSVLEHGVERELVPTEQGEERGPVPEEIVGVETQGPGREETIGAEAGGPQYVPEEVSKGKPEYVPDKVSEGAGEARGPEEMVETKDGIGALPFVEETPTVEVRPRTRNRKKRNGR